MLRWIGKHLYLMIFQWLVLLFSQCTCIWNDEHSTLVHTHFAQHSMFLKSLCTYTSYIKKVWLQRRIDYSLKTVSKRCMILVTFELTGKLRSQPSSATCRIKARRSAKVWMWSVFFSACREVLSYVRSEIEQILELYRTIKGYEKLIFLGTVVHM